MDSHSLHWIFIQIRLIFSTRNETTVSEKKVKVIAVTISDGCKRQIILFAYEILDWYRRSENSITWKQMLKTSKAFMLNLLLVGNNFPPGSNKFLWFGPRI